MIVCRLDVILDYIMGDTLSLAKAEGYVNVRQWDTWAPSILGERESFDLILVEH